MLTPVITQMTMKKILSRRKARTQSQTELMRTCTSPSLLISPRVLQVTVLCPLPPRHHPSPPHCHPQQHPNQIPRCTRMSGLNQTLAVYHCLPRLPLYPADQTHPKAKRVLKASHTGKVNHWTRREGESMVLPDLLSLVEGNLRMNLSTTIAAKVVL